MASKNEMQRTKKLVKKDVDKELRKIIQAPRKVSRPPRQPSTKVAASGSVSKGNAFAPAGVGPSRLTTTSVQNIQQEQYNHAMSLLNPSDRAYNWAPAAQAVGAPTIVYRTEEVVTAGCPGVSTEPGALAQANMGMGAVMCRPNALFNHWMFTSGSDVMGYEPSNDKLAPALCVMNPTEGSQAGESFFTLNFSGALGPNFIQDKGTSVPDWYAAAQAVMIQNQGSLFRCTSASLEVSYMGPTMLGSGIIVAAPIPRDALVGYSGESDQLGGVYTAPGISFTDLLKLYNSSNNPAIQGAHIKYLPYDDKPFEMKPTVFQYEGFVLAADTLPKAERIRVTALSPYKGNNVVKNAFHHVVKTRTPASAITFNSDNVEKGKPPKPVFSFEEAGSIDAVLDYFASVRWLSDPKNTTAISSKSPEALERVCTFIKASRHLDAPPEISFRLWIILVHLAASHNRVISPLMLLKLLALLALVGRLLASLTSILTLTPSSRQSPTLIGLTPNPFSASPGRDAPSTLTQCLRPTLDNSLRSRSMLTMRSCLLRILSRLPLMATLPPLQFHHLLRCLLSKLQACPSLLARAPDRKSVV